MMVGFDEEVREFNRLFNDRMGDTEICDGCNKVNCDCDEQTEELRDREMREEDERALEHEREMEYPYDN